MAQHPIEPSFLVEPAARSAPQLFLGAANTARCVVQSFLDKF
ncbi:MAG: hypothetical protein WCD53_19045 [Microcoleus sp.]